MTATGSVWSLVPLLGLLLLEFATTSTRAQNVTDSRSDCDYTQFGKTHSAVLPSKKKCKNFKLIAGDIFKKGVSEEDKKFILKTHNDLRSKVAAGLENRGNPGPQYSGTNLREFVWNDQLAEVAQGWANQCALKHDKTSNRKTCEHKLVGQNIAHKTIRGNTPSTELWKKAIHALFNEVQYMKQSAVDKLENTGKTGHYTQIVWAKTYQVGCGVVNYYLYKVNKNGSRKRFIARSSVCNYWPSGNYKGAPVYERGPTASNCDNGVSNNYPNLCAPPSQ